MEKQELTGYPHLDRPWMKYYQESLARMELPKETIYQFMRRNTEQYLRNIFITYNGKEENGYEFLENIDKAAKVLSSIGVDNGQRIMYLMPNLPETAYTFYGTSKIGAVSDYADPRPDSINPEISSQKMLKMIINEKIKYIVVFESCYLSMIKPIENELKELGIGPVVVISSTELMSAKQQMYYIEESARLYGLKNTLKKIKFMREYSEKTQEEMRKSPLTVLKYSELLKEIRYEKVKEAEFEPDKLASITHSSGTTSSFPKTIPLKNEGINSYAFQLTRSNVNTSMGDKSLHILPYFSAYGLGISHMGFSMADNMVQIPEFSPSAMGKLIKKHRPNIIMGTPNWYLSLPHDKCLSKADLSFIKVIGYGGDSMNEHDEVEVNEFLAQRKCPEKITKGHGMSETSGGASYASGEYNIPGSMGIPMIDTIYGIVDPETHKPLKFEQDSDRLTGELIISSPAIVDETIDGRKVIEHGMIDGTDFIYTKDIGSMDKNGVLYFLSRNDRGFTRYDGFKVKPYEIEKHIKNLPFIKDCIISSYEDPSKFGKMIRADIIMMEGWETQFESLKDVVTAIIKNAFTNNDQVSTRQIPTKFNFRDSFPLTLNNKVDYRQIALEPIPDDALTVEIIESNVSVSDIRIIEPGKKLIKKI